MKKYWNHNSWTHSQFQLAYFQNKPCPSCFFLSLLCDMNVSSNAFVLLTPHWMIAEYFPLLLKVISFLQISVSISYGEALVFSLSVISVILERQSTNRQCILFWLFQPCLLYIFLLFDLNYIEWRNRRKWCCFLKSIPSAF